MKFRTISSPHIMAGPGVSRVMGMVLLALLPGTGLSIWVFGWGVLVNLLLGIGTAVTAEALVMLARGRPVRPALADLSAVLTGWIFAICLPPLIPWWVTVTAATFAIVVAKHLYGGLGQNPFNPSMAGLMVVLVSFPREIALRPPVTMLSPHDFSLAESARAIFTGRLPHGLDWDALSAATPLDRLRTGIGLDRSVEEVLADPGFGYVAGQGSEWIVLAWLVGGLFLISRRVIDWRIPVSMLGTLILVSGIFYLIDPTHYASPLFHLFSGAAVLGAFFVSSDPVTASTTVRGRLIYGAGIALLVYIIRNFGAYPEGLAFAILLMNMAAPTIDRYTQPRVFGQGLKKGER